MTPGLKALDELSSFTTFLYPHEDPVAIQTRFEVCFCREEPSEFYCV